MYLEQFKNRFLLEFSLAFRQKVSPCTEEEINLLEEKLGLFLPMAYKEFLLWGGHKAGGLMEGSDCFYRHLLRNQETARSILEDDEFIKPLPEDAFVFFTHHDYMFLFFQTSYVEDPAVYGYTEKQVKKRFILCNPKYSDFLMDYLEREGEFRIKHKL